jgi:glycosyltransferase involved in cell wall biosynthesis
MAISSNNLEIIIQDNCSTDQTKSISLKAVNNDPRVKYYRQPTRVSMRRNFESGVENSRGDYIIFIGDDDAMLPEQFTKLELIIQSKQPDCLSWHALRYTWPGLKGKTGSVTFRAQKIHGNPFRLPTKKIAEDLHAGLISGPKPSIYHGCASRKLLNKIQLRQGLIFAGSSPDVYFSYAALLTEDLNAWHINHPFTISGIGPKSNGNAFNLKNRSSIDGSVNKNGAMFISEVAHDMVKDAMPNLMTESQYVQPVFFNMYETAKAFTKTSHNKTNYNQWYHNILSFLPKNAKKATYQALKMHAKQTNSSEHLDEAYVGNSIRSKSSILEFKLNKIYLKIASTCFRFQINTSIENSNTIYTAALWSDIILGKPDSECQKISKNPFLSLKISWIMGLIRKYRYNSNSRKIKLCASNTHPAPH